MHITLTNELLLLNWITSCIVLTFIVANFVTDILLYLQRKELRKEFEKERQQYSESIGRGNKAPIIPFKKPAVHDE